MTHSPQTEDGRLDQAIANGRNLYYEGQHGPEDQADTAQRLTLVAERDQLRTEADQFKALAKGNADALGASLAECQQLRAQVERFRLALRFYANGEHFNTDDDEEFDTVSGEPANWLYSGREDSTTSIEDGSIAKLTLQGKVVNWIAEGEDSTPKPINGEDACHVARGERVQGGEPVAWHYVCKKPGTTMEFASIHPDDAAHWPLSQWTSVEKRPLVYPSAPAQPAAPAPFLVRDIAEMLSTDVPYVCKAFTDLGLPPRSTNMAVTPDEAVAVAKHLTAAPAPIHAPTGDWMPLMGTGLAIRFDVLNEAQAQRNHGQSLKRLRERGGLGPDEALAIAEKQKWRSRDIEGSITALSALAKAAAPVLVPPGFWLAPDEPTSEIENALADNIVATSRGGIMGTKRAYRAMRNAHKGIGQPVGGEG